MISHICSNCQQRLQIPDEYAGQQGRCRKCGARFTVGVQRPNFEDTVPLRRRTVWPWVAVAGLAILATAGVALWGQSRLRGETAAAEAPVTEAEASEPSVDLEQIPPAPSMCAVEMAATQTQSTQPPDAIIQEFDGLLAKMKVQYTRSSEMQLRDAVYEVYSLRAYNRPDLDPLRAARMIVDWMPPSAFVLAAEAAIIENSQGDKTSIRSASKRTLAVQDIPVSMAVESISSEILAQYNQWVGAQWDAYYAQQEAQMAEAARQDAIRQAQAEANEQARRARDQAIMDQQRWQRENSIAGQLAVRPGSLSGVAGRR